MDAVAAVVEIDDASGAALSAGLARAAAHDGVESLLVLLATEAPARLRGLDAAIAEVEIPIIGGVFPRVLAGTQARAEGGVIVALTVPLHTVRLPMSAASSSDPTRAGELHHLVGPATLGATVFTFFDAASAGVETLLEAVFDAFGPSPNYVGGGAGGLDFLPSPCVIDSDGVHESVAVVGVAAVGSTVEVDHGWRSVGDSMRVTAIAGRRLQELEHRPAGEVYRAAVAALPGIAPEMVEDQLQSYPLGVVGLEDDIVVRDVIGIDGDDVLLVAEASRWSVVRLLHGDESSLLDAAARVRDRIAPQVVAGQPVLVFDCISRTLHLGDRFSEELSILAGPDTLVGAATIGEVCNPGDRFIDLYNKTVVGVALGGADGLAERGPGA